MAARQEGHGAIQIDGVAALDLVEDLAGDFLVGVERHFQLVPALLAARLVARQNGFAKRIFNALQVNLDLVANLQAAILGGRAKFLQRHTAFGLQAHIDDGKVFFDADHGAFDNGSFQKVVAAKALIEERCKIFAAERASVGVCHSHVCLSFVRPNFRRNGRRLVLRQSLLQPGSAPCWEPERTALPEALFEHCRKGRNVRDIVIAISQFCSTGLSRSFAFHKVPRGLERRVYTHFRRIEQQGIVSLGQRRIGPA